ncbi:hypothetical protein D9M72_503340 [compost metagenome]
MEHHARVLQQRIEVAPGHCRRQQAHEGVGGKQQEQQEARADRAHHAQHACHRGQRQLAAVVRHRQRPQCQHQRPQQHRAFMPAPYRCHAVGQRQRAVGVGGDIAHAEVVGDEAPCQRRERQRNQRALHARRRPRHRHPRQPATRGAGQRHHCLRQRDQQRDDQREVPQLGDHWRAPCAGAPAMRRFTCSACFSASAASGGM